MKDEVISELWRIKDQIAAEHNYDLASLVESLRKSQKNREQKIVDRSKSKKTRAGLSAKTRI